MRAADPTPQPAALGHEPAVAAGPDGYEARGLARLAASPSPEARLVLPSALAEADAPDEDDRPTWHGSGREPSSDAPWGAPGLTVVPPPSGLRVLPAYQEPEPGRPADDRGSGDAGSGDPGSWPAPRGLVRLRFADAVALERADAAFAAGSGPGLGDARSDPAALTLQIPGDAAVETLRAVLAILDAAGIASESLTVHSYELDDVLAAFTGLP
ncbi:hypothetical protein ACFW2T_27170 [Streptomyces sp. NPDC058892]|uniref:hypothetical protein n=1 Tax=unclassified Streptomyces TaxID=2593676 RepID=UPI00368AD597